MKYTVLDILTNAAPNLDDLVYEDWMHDLLMWDPEEFAVTPDGGIVILDSLGNYIDCPPGRFAIKVSLIRVDEA